MRDGVICDWPVRGREGHAPAGWSGWGRRWSRCTWRYTSVASTQRSVYRGGACYLGGGVVVRDVLPQRYGEVAWSGDLQVVEAFAAQVPIQRSAMAWLAVLVPGADDADVGSGENGVEGVVNLLYRS